MSQAVGDVGMRSTVWAAVAGFVLAAAGLAVEEARAAAPLRDPGRVDSCSWDRPGHNPFMGDVVASLDRYGDIPADVRARLQQRMAARDYDDLVTIRRDSIEGKHFYEPRITEMHFGEGSICKDVTRERWTAAMEERGLVYCDSGHCILVPTVCRNVSRIARRPTAVAPAVAEADEEPVPPGGGDPMAGESFASALGDPVPPLLPMAADPGPRVWGPSPARGPGGWVPGRPGRGSDGTPDDEEPGPGPGPVPGPGTHGPGPGPGPGPGEPGAPGGHGAAGGHGAPGGHGGPDGPGPSPTPVPEPSTWLLMAGGLAALAWRAQRRGVPRCATQKR